MQMKSDFATWLFYNEDMPDSILKCEVCHEPIETDRFHPNRRFCGRQCSLKVWRDKNREKLNAESNARAKANPEKRRETMRKYHASPKGQKRSKEWTIKNKDHRTRKYLERYRNDTYVRKIQMSRYNARNKLKRAKHIPYACNGCDATTRLHAHHKNLNPLDNDLGNLMWFCRWCHTKVHTELRRAQPNP